LACASLDSKIFFSKSGRFNISVYEAIFVAACEDAFKAKGFDLRTFNSEQVSRLKSDSAFIDATQSRTSGAANVKTRIDKAKMIL
jgi:hypothetical protein